MNCAKYSSAAPMCACGRPIPPKSTPGRPRKTCGADCPLFAPKEPKYKQISERTYECAVCYSSFEADRGRQFCGSYCKSRAKYLKNRPNAQACGPLAHLVERPCANCGKDFKPRLARYGTYCTRECGFAGEARRRTEKAKANAIGPSCPVYFKTCTSCGKAWTTRHKLAPTCSDGCRRALANAKGLARNIASAGEKPVRQCRCCGAEFSPSYGDKRNLFCGSACAKRIARRSVPKDARKRARHYGVEYEYINRIKVFNRDGWRCQICGRATPQVRMGSLKPNAPELDHRIPISIGGGHTYANVQCACRRCNGEKGNSSSAGQLPLLPIDHAVTGRGSKV